MKITKIGRFLREDFPEAGPWFGRFLTSLNQFIDNVQTALDRGLGWDNVKGERRDVTFSTGADPDAAFPLSFRSSQGKATDVWITEAWDVTAGETPILKPRFAHNSSGDTVTITAMDTIEADKKYRIRFLTLCT